MDLQLMAGVGILLAGMGGYFGYDYASAKCAAEREAVSRATAEALATLATRFQDAEIAYQQERARKAKVRERIVTEVRYEVRELPQRDCPLLPDTRGLLIRAHCAATGSDDPECVSGAVQPDAEAATSGSRRADGD